MELSQLLEKITSLNILILGDLILDEYIEGSCSRISPEAPVPIVHVTRERQVLGGAGNTAANIVSLGAKAHVLGLCGVDSAATGLRNILAQLGISFDLVEHSRPTIRKSRVISQAQQLLRLDYESPSPMDAQTESEVIQLFKNRLKECDAVILSDYAKGFVTESLCQSIIAEAHQAKKPILIDPRPQHGAFYQGADYLTPNWKECLGLLGESSESEASLNEEKIALYGRRLSDLLNVNLILTLGAKGISYFSKSGGKALRMPTAAKEVFDVSGAGDTVAAAFTLAIAAGSNPHDAVDFANKAAGIVVGKLGTATVTPHEILKGHDWRARLLSREALAPLSAALRAEGKAIVSINGSFDLLHAGHLHILAEAKRQGDVLVVGLNSDASVRSYKSVGRPLIAEEQRAQMLLSLRLVDYVHIFDESVPMPFLSELKPQIHVNGSEYGEECIEADTVKKLGGRIHIVEKIAGLSTSALVAAIKKLP